MSNEQTVTTNIKTSDDDLEILKKHFPQCFDKNGNFQFEKFKNKSSAVDKLVTAHSQEGARKSMLPRYSKLCHPTRQSDLENNLLNYTSH
ncbi:MAG: hypothetical protein KBG25_07040 [Paludibacteraceae bacterium]|nr:hypothetical protein [Paludibacteraceae bacterium]